MVVGAGLRFVLAGVLAGMAASLVLVRLIEAQLADVAAHDPVRLAGTAMLLTMTAGIACWIPAKGGARRSVGRAALRIAVAIGQAT
jgi:putative ABC transport system permease protein